MSNMMEEIEELFLKWKSLISGKNSYHSYSFDENSAKLLAYMLNDFFKAQKIPSHLINTATSQVILEWAKSVAHSSYSIYSQESLSEFILKTNWQIRNSLK